MKTDLDEFAELETRLLEDEKDDEKDMLPEYCHYRDEGCDLAESCLNCPFPQCIYEEAGGRQRWLKKRRDREIARLFSSEGKNARDLALLCGLSPRTVQRALKSSLPARKGLSIMEGNTGNE